MRDSLDDTYFACSLDDSDDSLARNFRQGWTGQYTESANRPTISNRIHFDQTSSEVET